MLRSIYWNKVYFTAEDDITDFSVIITINLDCKFLFCSIKNLSFKKSFFPKIAYFPFLHSFPTKCTTETFPFIVDTLGHLDLKSDNT